MHLDISKYTDEKLHCRHDSDSCGKAVVGTNPEGKFHDGYPVDGRIDHVKGGQDDELKGSINC